MTTNERLLIGALYAVMMGLMTWMLGTVSTNSGRIAVLEQRANNHVREMSDMRDDLKQHRNNTEYQQWMEEFNKRKSSGLSR